jgi:hypothetical protein
MKITKYLLIVAIFGAGLFASCTPESIDNGQNEQQIDRDRNRPAQNG